MAELGTYFTTIIADATTSESFWTSTNTALAGVVMTLAIVMIDRYWMNRERRKKTVR